MVRLDQFTEEHLELGDLWRLQDGRREECFLIPLMATQAGQLGPCLFAHCFDYRPVLSYRA